MSWATPLRITASVGNGDINQRDDVIAIQALLNTYLPKSISPLRVDGLYGLRTYEAIRNIQKNLVGMAYPDGRIDPQGPTLCLLNKSKLNMVKIAASSKIKVQTASSNSSIPDAVIQAAQAAQKNGKFLHLSR